MTPWALASFLGIMLLLAALPSASVALVVARSSSCGLSNGIATIMGIVAADLLFVATAILGMSTLALSLGSVFAIAKYTGGAYLIWLGLKLITARESEAVSVQSNDGSTMAASFAAGFLLTLGDIKALLFYASLFPSLMDVTSLSVLDSALITGITVLTVGGVKLIYATSADALVTRLRSRRLSRHSKRIAGGILIGTGGTILIKA